MSSGWKREARLGGFRDSFIGNKMDMDFVFYLELQMVIGDGEDNRNANARIFSGNSDLSWK